MSEQNKMQRDAESWLADLASQMSSDSKWLDPDDDSPVPGIPMTLEDMIRAGHEGYSTEVSYTMGWSNWFFDHPEMEEMYWRCFETVTGKPRNPECAFSPFHPDHRLERHAVPFRCVC